MEIGQVIYDASYRITGRISNITSVGGSEYSGSLSYNNATQASIWNGGSGYYGDIYLDSNNEHSRYSDEVRPISNSAYVCIKY
jgi:hypothetical protein